MRRGLRSWLLLLLLDGRYGLLIGLRLACIGVASATGVIHIVGQPTLIIWTLLLAIVVGPLLVALLQVLLVLVVKEAHTVLDTINA